MPFALALSLACGISYAYILAYYNVDFIYAFTAVPVAGIILIIALVFLRRTSSCVYVALAALFFVLGAIYCGTVFENYGKSELPTGSLATVTGRVEEVGGTASGIPYLIVDDAFADGVALGGKVLVYLDEKAGGYADVGYDIRALATVEKLDAFAYGELNYRMIDGVKYQCTVYGGMEGKYNFSLFGSIRSGIYATLHDNTDGETAAVAYAMLTGNTQGVSEQTLSSFRYGGIAHVFAVSGLHIGVLFGAVSFILDRLRLNKRLSAFLKIAVIVFYCGVCGFTASSVRATVMCAVSVLSRLAFRKYDSLNSLSLAVVLLLLINPLNLFDAGFILSVSAMLGIIFLTPNVTQALFFLPAKIRGSLAVGISAQAATFPALLLTFGYVSVVGILLNVLVLPVLSFLYVVILAATVICMIIPPASALLPAVCAPLGGFVNLCVHLGFEDGIISGFGGWWIAVLIFAAIAALSDKFNFRRALRTAISLSCAAAFVLLTVFGGGVYGGECRVIIGAYYGGGMVLLRTGEGTSLVITDSIYCSRVESFIAEYVPGGVNDVIIIGGDACLELYYQNGLDFDRVYISQSYINLSVVDANGLHYERAFSLYGVDYEFYDGYTLKVSVNGVDLGICAGEYINVDGLDMLVSLKRDTQGKADTTVYFDLNGGDFNVYSQGCLQFVADSGTLKKTGINPNG